MATQTTKLLLRKPDPDPATGDFINVATDINNNADIIDAAVGYFICTSGTRPTGSNRWDGRPILETDTRRAYVWNNALTTWIPLLIARTADGPYLFGQSTDTSGEGANFRGTTAAANIVRSRVTSDANPRFTIDADGNMNWGPGSAALDVRLFRSGTGELSTDTGDALKVSGDFVAGSENGINVTGPTSGTDSSTSTSYTNMAGTGATTSFSFTKRFAGTRIKIEFAATFWSTNADTGVQFGVNFNATDYDICRLMGNTLTANQRLHTSGFRYISSVAAGAYTIQARWKKIAIGTGQINRNLEDFLCISAKETN